MKAKHKSKKDFDAVQLQQQLREEIGKELEGLTYEEEKAFLKKASDRLKKYKQVDKDK